MVFVQVFVGHQRLVPQLVVETKMLKPLVPIPIKVKLVDDLKGTRVRGAKRPLTPSLTSWEVGYASCSASTKGLFPEAQDTVSLVPGEQKQQLFSRGMAEMMMGDKREVRKLLNDRSKTAPSLIAYEQLPSHDLHLSHSHWSGQYNHLLATPWLFQNPENMPLPRCFVIMITTPSDHGCGLIII